MEEQAILDAMAEEARQKQRLAEEKMKQLAEDTEALAHEIERLQMEMKEDDVSFLMVRGLPSGFRDRDQVFRSWWGATVSGCWARGQAQRKTQRKVLLDRRPRPFSSEQLSRRPLHFSLPLSPILAVSLLLLYPLLLFLFSFLLSLLLNANGVLFKINFLFWVNFRFMEKSQNSTECSASGFSHC